MKHDYSLADLYHDIGRSVHGAKPSGKPWRDPADLAWAHVNKRTAHARTATERAAFRFIARLYP
jgi:hypothetical protein